MVIILTVRVLFIIFAIEKSCFNSKFAHKTYDEEWT